MTSLRLLLAMTLPLALAPSGYAASFRGLGDLPGGVFDSRAYGVSADGSVIIGQSRTANGIEAFRWTAETGMVGLGFLPGQASSMANAISDDGSTIVGNSGNEAFRWTSQTGMIGLGDLSGGSFESRANGVSADGSVIVGEGELESGPTAFRWTKAEGMIPLEVIVDDSVAYAVSADGSVITGAADRGAFRWTADTGFQIFKVEPDPEAAGLAISADGSVIVGYGIPDHLVRPLYYANGEVEFLISSELVTLLAYDVSADGSTVVGGYDFPLDNLAFVWDKANGMRRLQNIFANQGLDTTGWTLREARGISADGRTIVGWARNPAGQTEGWIAVIPEPSSCYLAVITGYGMLFFGQSLAKQRRGLA